MPMPHLLDIQTAAFQTLLVPDDVHGARQRCRRGRGLLPGVEVYTRFVVFWAGSTICLADLTASLVNRGLIGLGEYGSTIVGYSCIFLIFWDLLFLLEYMSVLYEMDDEGEDEE